MESRWSDREAAEYVERFAPRWGEALALRVYTSRLIGRDPDLVMHGGGNTSLTALQALAMLNDPFVVRYSQHLAERLEKERPTTPLRIARLYELTLNRPPTEGESAALADYAAKHGLPNACRLLLNSNEFLFVD